MQMKERHQRDGLDLGAGKGKSASRGVEHLIFVLWCVANAVTNQSDLVKFEPIESKICSDLMYLIVTSLGSVPRGVALSQLPP